MTLAVELVYAMLPVTWLPDEGVLTVTGLDDLELASE